MTEYDGLTDTLDCGCCACCGCSCPTPPDDLALEKVRFVFASGGLTLNDVDLAQMKAMAAMRGLQKMTFVHGAFSVSITFTDLPNHLPPPV